MRTPLRRPSRRQTLLANKAVIDFHAAAADKTYKFQTPIPPARKARIRRPVDGLAPTPTEYQEQGAVIEWWWRSHKLYGLPEFALFAIPNGSYLASGYAGAAMLKKTGQRNGAPDLCLAVPRHDQHGLYIEMKSVNGRESPEQQAFGEYLQSAGYRFQFAYGATRAIEVIKEYLA